MICQDHVQADQHRLLSRPLCFSAFPCPAEALLLFHLFSSSLRNLIALSFDIVVSSLLIEYTIK